MTPQERKVMELALEALEECRRDPRLKYEHPTYDKTITAIKEALMSVPDGARPAVAEQHKQRSVSEQLEPVAYRCIVVDVDYSMDTAAILIQDTRDYEFNDGQYWLSTTPYVATPRPQPQSEARGLSQSKPLTDEQIFVIKHNWITTPFVNHLDFARAIEAAHGIKE